MDFQSLKTDSEKGKQSKVFCKQSLSVIDV